MPKAQTPIAPENPDYGSGCFRRRIRLIGEPGRVTGELEDNCHGFRCTVFHDGRAVTDVQAEGLRIPYNTCAGAAEPIKALIGIELDRDPKIINETVDPRANCTHIYDLAVLAIAHASRGATTRLYDVRVDDERDGAAEAVVRCNGKVAHCWQIAQWQVLEPTELRGRPLFKGFAAWANETFAGDEREAAFVLHKGVFVSASRRYDIDRFAGQPAIENPQMRGVCYTYSTGVVESAVRLADTVRDFSNCPEELLKFR